MIHKQYALALAILAATCLSAVGCTKTKRVTVVKVYEAYGDYTDKDRLFTERLCLSKIKGAIAQDEFDRKYSETSVRLVSGPALKYSVKGQIDERRKEEEEYIDMVEVPTYINDVAMDDGRVMPVKKTRTVIHGSLRNINAECTAFEYHF